MEIKIPGSKSYTNRALIMAALTKGRVTLISPLYSDDTYAMIDSLQKLGIEIEVFPEKLVVIGDVDSIENKEYELFAKDSGTTVRFLLSFLCIVKGVQTIYGNKRLNERPISDLVDSLRDLGAKIEYVEKEGNLPLRIKSSTLLNTKAQLKSHLSSQFCTSLLLIAPYIGKSFEIEVEGNLISKPYVEMTIACMRDWGVNVKKGEEGKFFIDGGKYVKSEYVIEGDFSSAGYFFAAALLKKRKITLTNLNPFSIQADRKFLQILEKMGNPLFFDGNTCHFEGKKWMPIEVDMEDCPDQVMTMAVLAAFMKGVTKIRGVRSLRYKETERVKALTQELQKMGIKTEDTYDTLTIFGGEPKGALIKTYNDHRMAMSFAIATLFFPEMKIETPEVVNKTFPNFWNLFERLK